MEKLAIDQVKLSTQEANCLVSKYGTPVFVFDKDLFVNRLDKLKESFQKEFTSHGLDCSFFYAGKAFLSKEVAKIAAKYGYGIDTCSLVEQLTALEGGVAGPLLGLHGNNKSDEEIELAIKQQFARIVIDSEEEILRIVNISQKIANQAKVKVMLRITTGIHAGGHEFISTAHEDQKFGVPITGNVALNLLKQILLHPELELTGIHTHIGSQISAPEAFIESARAMMKLREDLYKDTNYNLQEIDLGGGFGIQYTEDDELLDIENLAKDLAEALLGYVKNSKNINLSAPKFSFEPGRWVMGPSQSTLYTVGTIKDVKLSEPVEYQGQIYSSRRYVSVDGGMSDNIRPALYGAKYSVVLFQNESKDSDEQILCRIVGKHCESGDILISECLLPNNLHTGDILDIPVTGAYGYSMSSNYNMLLKPAVVEIYKNQENNRCSKILIPRQIPKQLIF
ncbi:MAG: diaminopimelate decarboxylase [Candidatus Ancillula sp.]|jgi:diaminopimelate decarboxylase|nr:diaminopimelate decarboxylase [Candidatus Ancillula sp.]